MRRNINILIYLIPFFSLFGETFRVPFGFLNGLTLIDLAVSIVAAYYLIYIIFSRQNFQIKQLKLFKPFAFFILSAILSLTLSLFSLSLTQAIPGSLYLIRFIEYALLYFICSQKIKSEKDIATLINTNIFAGVILSILGFIQLKFFPSLESLEKFGYDPHINRLVSTWLDPNLLAGFLTFIFLLGLSKLYSVKKPLEKFYYSFTCLILLIAIFLTYSRSGYLCLIFGFLAFALMKSRKLLITIIIAFALLLSLSQRAQERVSDLIGSATSLFFNTNKPLDPTAKFRLKSWEENIEIFKENPVLGVGYNNLREIKLNKGLVDDLQNHAASGSDSTILTILSTTGIIGLFFYLLIIYQSLRLSFKESLYSKNPQKSILAVAVFSGLAGFLIHSIFVNSLLFAPIMALTFCCLGALEKHPQE